MIKKTEITRQKLFDGDQESCLREIFEIEHQKIRLADFYNNPLKDLKKEIKVEIFSTIVGESNFRIKNSFIRKYESQEGLEVFYIKNEDLIALLSCGEYQPARFIVFLESIWLIKSRI
ncbi:hypothetical protein [uncultured Chryseobacterium sp.]|uniref:hypothetical protein n=1 Tax=uncultured Chryseobacterium sp. TaxID=259322 RepID=UPI0025FC1237|nr:hypothetical protein [uncultured Chryseobacterium sp.]